MSLDLCNRFSHFCWNESRFRNLIVWITSRGNLYSYLLLVIIHNSFLYLFYFFKMLFFSCSFFFYTYTNSHTHSPSLSLTHSYTHTLYISLSLSLTHTHTHTHTHKICSSCWKNLLGPVGLNGKKYIYADIIYFGLYLPLTGRKTKHNFCFKSPSRPWERY